jgi:hypothetical protein
LPPWWHHTAFKSQLTKSLRFLFSCLLVNRELLLAVNEQNWTRSPPDEPQRLFAARFTVQTHFDYEIGG